MAVTTPCLFIVRREKDGIVSSVNNIPWRNTNISSSLPVSPTHSGQTREIHGLFTGYTSKGSFAINSCRRIRFRSLFRRMNIPVYKIGYGCLRRYIEEYMIYSSMCLYNFLASFIYLEQFRHIMIPSQKEYPFTARVIHYMRENIQQNLTLKELASYFKYSPSHFSALFFGETGVSPMNYFIRLKIQKACEYIELTNMKLNEIATHLGFEDAAYFSRTFTKVMGCSPSVYRKKEMEI